MVTSEAKRSRASAGGTFDLSEDRGEAPFEV